jgi:hypothetical protein
MDEARLSLLACRFNALPVLESNNLAVLSKRSIWDDLDGLREVVSGAMSKKLVDAEAEVEENDTAPRRRLRLSPEEFSHAICLFEQALSRSLPWPPASLWDSSTDNLCSMSTTSRGPGRIWNMVRGLTGRHKSTPISGSQEDAWGGLKLWAVIVALPVLLIKISNVLHSKI